MSAEQPAPYEAYPVPPELQGIDLRQQTPAEAAAKSQGCLACHQQVVDDAGHRGRRRAEGEADRPAALLDVGLDDQAFGLGVSHVVDAGDHAALVRLALVLS